jgi:hypothetical protein
VRQARRRLCIATTNYSAMRVPRDRSDQLLPLRRRQRLDADHRSAPSLEVNRSR